MSRMPELQAAQVMGSRGPAQPRRKRTESMYSSGGVAKLGETHASSPRTFALVHLQQPLTDSRVNARSDNALDLDSPSRMRVLIIAITVIRRDAPSVARIRGRLILHGWLGTREHVLPGEMTLCVGLIKLG